MHLPIPRDRKVQRIDFAADHHNAVLARAAVAAAGVEIFDHKQFVPRQVRCRLSQSGPVRDENEIAPGVIARRTQQQRKGKAVFGDPRFTERAREDVAPDRQGFWRNHPWQGCKPPCVVDAPAFHYRAGVVDHRGRAARHQLDSGLKRRAAKIGIADRVEDELVRWQRQARIEIVGNDDCCREDAVVKERGGWNVAAAG